MFGTGLLRGLGVTLKHIFETYVDDIKGIPSRYAGGKDFLENLARERGCDNVRFLGPVRRSSMQALLARMDICLAATRNSPLYRFGISLTKMFDYMLAAKPIVLSSGASGDLVASVGCGLVSPPEDPAAAADAIMAIASLEPEERAAMGERGRKVLLAEYTHGTLSRRWLDRLESLRLVGEAGR